MVIGEVQGRQLIGRPLSMLLTGGCGYGDLRFNQLSTSGAVDLAIRPIISSSDGPCTSSNPSRANMHD